MQNYAHIQYVYILYQQMLPTILLATYISISMQSDGSWLGQKRLFVKENN